MKWNRIASSLALTAFLGLGSGIARADDLKTTARAVAAKSQKSVITARLVVKITIGDRDQEQKLELTGTVIDASGLTVVSAASIDPAGAFRGMMGGRRGGGGGGGGGGGDMRIESEVTETALVLEDGTEIEADVVLKDPELDLAFIKPRDDKAKFEFVELKPRAAAPAALDEVFVVGRLGRVANRAISLATGAVKAVVKGPHTFYVCDDQVSSGSIGCLAYGADGAPLGLFVTKRPTEGGGRGGGVQAIAIVRPVEDVIELATQAKTKAPEKKKDEPKKDEKKEEPKKDEPKKDEKKPEKKNGDF